MRAQLIINDKSFGGYIAENGLQFQRVQRKDKTVVTIDGTKYFKGRDKWQIGVSLLDMPDTYYQDIVFFLKLRNPANVEYTDLETGNTITGKFYVKDISHKVYRVIGQTTYLNSLSFNLEEK